MKWAPKYDFTMIDLVKFIRNTGMELTLSVEGMDTLCIRAKKDILAMDRKVGMAGLDDDANTVIIKYNLDYLAKSIMAADYEMHQPVHGIDAD